MKIARTLLTVGCLLGLGAVPASAGDNLVVNGDLSVPLQQDKKRGNWNVLLTGSQIGSFSPLQSGLTQKDGVLTIDLVAAGDEHGAAKGLIQLHQLIPALEIGTKYRLSFEAKGGASGLSMRVGVGIPIAGAQLIGGLAWTEETLTTNWKPYVFEFVATDPPEGVDAEKFTRVDIRVATGAGSFSIREIQLTAE